MSFINETLLRHKKFRKKVAQFRKLKGRDPLVSPGFVAYLKKVKKEPFAVSLHWPDLALGVSLKSEPINVSLKKKVPVRVGHFSLKGKSADNKMEGDSL